MPFKSKHQQGYLFAKKPEVAKKFAAETPKSSYKSLPLQVPKKPGSDEERGESGPDPDDKKKGRRNAAGLWNSMC
jgi:hypothetical protein